jgi:diguanylate cyclase (GGDEF)-like protein
VSRTAVRAVALTAVLLTVLHVITDHLVEDFLRWGGAGDQVLEVTLMTLVTCTLLWLGVLRPLLAQVARERSAAASRQALIEAGARQQEFEAVLHRALEMAGTEEGAYRTTLKALKAARPAGDAELLLADSSQAHLKRVLAVQSDGPAACGVVAPRDCPAVRRATTLTFRSSDDLDACPFLDGRPDGSMSASCVPMNVGGRSIGVLHCTGEDGAPPDGDELARLEVIASHAGARIGMLRVMEATTLQAATDPLTGLLNRRSLENRVHELARRGAPYAIAVGDLDHFKRLNDTHGHEAGDRALRLFARTMARVFRSEDLVCRFGGEEFVIVFPDRSVPDAAVALERLQQELMLAVAAGTVPGFTVSFGVAHSSDAASFEELYQVADAALFRAKRAGRNRIVADDRAVEAPASREPAPGR